MEHQVWKENFPIVNPDYHVAEGFSQHGVLVYIETSRQNDKYKWENRKVIAEVWPPKTGENKIHLNVRDDIKAWKSVEFPVPEENKQEALESIAKNAAKFIAKNNGATLVDKT